jgi:hypothetical protein
MLILDRALPTPSRARATRANEAATHLADVARALADMRGCATAISSTQRIDDEEFALVQRLLPTFAQSCGLRYTARRDGDSVTVRFERIEP